MKDEIMISGIVKTKDEVGFSIEFDDIEEWFQFDQIDCSDDIELGEEISFWISEQLANDKGLI